MGNNKKDFLAKQQALFQGYFEEGEKIGMQKMWDYIQVVLREPETMNKDVFGRARIEKIFRRLSEMVDHYHTAFTDDVEADYVQEELDAKLREIWGDDLNTFYERYPQLKKLGYEKPRKGWK